MARAGAILRIGHDGSLAVERGLVHPDDVNSVGKAPVSKERKDSAAIPASVVKELSAHRTAAMQADLAQNLSLALAMTVYTLALPLFGGNSSHSCLQIGLKGLKPAQLLTVAEDCDGHVTMAAEAEMWGDRLPGNPVDLFNWCPEQPQDVLLSLLASARPRASMPSKISSTRTPRRDLSMPTCWPRA